MAEIGRGTRRFRQAVLLAAILPDLDGLFTFYNQAMYEIYHDRITHSLLLSVLVSAVAMVLCRGERTKTLIFAQIAFYTHYFGDYFFSGWPLAYWFPFSKKEFICEQAFWLGHPINYIVWIVTFIIIVLMAWRLKRSPFEALSEQLDKRICNYFFRAKDSVCSFCLTRTNERCSTCGMSVCIQHGPLNKSLNRYV